MTLQQEIHVVIQSQYHLYEELLAEFLMQMMMQMIFYS